jgi:hypothetical protein
VRFAIGELVGIRLRKLNPLRAGADGIDDYAVTLRHFNRFRASVIGKIVVTIADQNHYAAHDVRLIARWTRRMAQFFFAGAVDCVVNGGPASRARFHNFIAQAPGVVGEGLQNGRLVIEGHYESLVFVMPQDAEEKRSGRVLLKFQAVPNAVGGVHQQANAQRKIGLTAEVADRLRSFVVRDFEIVFIEIGHQFVASIQDGE